MPHISFGAQKSKKDRRDHRDKNLALSPVYPQKYDVDMKNIAPFYQGKIGVCTAAALVCAIIEQLYREKNKKHIRLSVAFLYIVTKKIIDKNNSEGSSLRSALKAAYKFGVCTEETFPTDVELSHAEFLAQTIPEKAWTEALNYTIGGYISVPLDESLMAAHMYKYGPLYARFEVSHTWFTPSWLEKDISPLISGKPILSGHAVALVGYDLSIDKKGMWLRNSWGPTWFRNGDGFFNYRDYKPTEVWAVSLDSTMGMQEQSSFLSDIHRGFLNVLRRIGMLW